jgi:transposase
VSIPIFNGQVYTMDETEVVQDVVQPTRRRRHSKEFKEKVIRAAMQPNVSIAAVALHYRLNANLVRSWVSAQEERDTQDVARQELNATPLFRCNWTGRMRQPARCISRLRCAGGATTIAVRWPLSASNECARWLQGWLR